MYDAIIVGARCAGSPIAMLLARMGYRVLVLDRATGRISHRRFSELPELLVAGDLLVRNDVRVRPARLYGRDDEDRLVEIFLLRRSRMKGRASAAVPTSAEKPRPCSSVRSRKTERRAR
jgi:S-adenosylmethionine:tRNA-ribosyltransferase-isomerase (queuine synthetase)